MAAMCSTPLTLPLPAKSQEGSFAPFSFAFITDAHLANGVPDSYKLVAESQLFLQDAIKQLNAERVDFVIFGGDMIDSLGKDESHWQFFLDVVQSLSLPWSFVLGEHDISSPDPVNKMRTFGPDWKGRGIEFNHPHWSQDPLPGVHIIGLDTSRQNSALGEVSREQLDWLREDLRRHQGQFTIVFSHHPLLPPSPYDGGHPWEDYILPQGPVLRELLAGYKQVHLAVSGHVHVSCVEREADIWYVCAPSLDVYPCSYKVFRVTPESITMENRQVSFPALVRKARESLAASRLAQQFDRSKPYAFVTLAEGQRKDQDAVLALASGAQAKPISRTGRFNPFGRGDKRQPSKRQAAGRAGAADAARHARKEDRIETAQPYPSSSEAK